MLAQTHPLIVVDIEATNHFRRRISVQSLTLPLTVLSLLLCAKELRRCGTQGIHFQTPEESRAVQAQC